MENGLDRIRHSVYHSEGNKLSVLEDHLAHQAVDDYQSMNFEFLDENIMLVTDYEEPGPYEGPLLGS